MKGISAVVTTVLLILIVVAVIGLAFTFFVGTQNAAQNSGNQALTNVLTKIDVPFSFENQVGTNFYIRNKGTTSITAGTLTVYADDAAVDAQIPQAIQPGAVGALTVPPEVIANNAKLRITGSVYEQTVTIQKGTIVGQW